MVVAVIAVLGLVVAADVLELVLARRSAGRRRSSLAF
jgi:hypothetical protein